MSAARIAESVGLGLFALAGCFFVMLSLSSGDRADAALGLGMLAFAKALEVSIRLRERES